MPHSFDNHLENLKTALHTLKPTGHDGFEGFIAKILSKIVGHPFRLAGSGSQHGKDGEAKFDACHVDFEAKLYSGGINKNEVLSKLTEIIGGSETPDIWILAATIEIKTQITAPFRNATEKNSIETLILDWPEAASIPPLATICAMADEETQDFFAAHTQNMAAVSKVKTALAAIRSHNDYCAVTNEISKKLRVPTLGLPIALDANRQWLKSAFSDRRIARQVFGQPLAPLAKTSLELRARNRLVKNLQSIAFADFSEKIIVLSGGEGCGKSWVFAHSWLTNAEPPLTLVIPATDLKSGDPHRDIESFLVEKLIEQTGDNWSEFNRSRWKNRFKQWKGNKDRSFPKLVVFVDGLNQQPEIEWPRWLDGLVPHIETLGGVLVISVREIYFRSRIRQNLYSPIQLIKVEEWSDSELDDILSTKQIDPSSLSQSVKKTLRNPRVLAIAFELLESARIDSFQELSVERLLFEHIRISARDGNSAEPVEIFSKRLSTHAHEIISRVESGTHEDRLVFDIGNRKKLTYDLNAVSEGRFFRALPEDSTLYSLTDDGLNYALGLSIIKSLQTANRNNRNLNEALDALLEPVAALDKTAEAVFSALLISSIDEQCVDPIRSALICSYLRLQNINKREYPVFVSVIRDAINSSMSALYELTVTDTYVAHEDWLLKALHTQRQNAACWEVMSNHLKKWLCLYSLSPKLAVYHRLQHEGPEKAEETINKQRVLLDEMQVSLSIPESEFLAEKMERIDDLDTSELSQKAFALLAGMPLAPFSEKLVAWSFSNSLNSSIRSRLEEFQLVVQFNMLDWQETRNALLEHSSILRSPKTSRIGKWALVKILRATATEEDSEFAETLVDELTADREKFPGWRLVEKYCATDPCDPLSKAPNNIKKTAETYREIDLNKLRTCSSMTQEDCFLRDARPGLARFSPQTAIEVQRRLAESIISRVGNKPLHALFSLKDKTAILESQVVSILINKAKELSGPYNEDSSESHDKWICSQYALLIAFPHYSGDRQLEIIMTLPKYGPPLLELADILKPANISSMEHALDAATRTDDRNMQLTTLMFAHYSGSKLSKRSREAIQIFLSNPDRAVRGEALGIVAYLKDSDLCKSVVNSGWTAQNLDSQVNYFERWYGTRVLVEAFRLGFLNAEEALCRMSPDHYGIAIPQLAPNDKSLIGQNLNASISKALEINIQFIPPEVEQNLEDKREAYSPPIKSLCPKDEESGIEGFMASMSETPEDFAARQRQAWSAFHEFEKDLNNKEASLMIESPSRAIVMACIESMPETVKEWANTFISLPDQELIRIQNLGLTVAECLSTTEPALSKKLFERLSGRRAFINLVFGLADISFEARCVWNSADNQEMNTLREERLDSALTDQAISMEVLTALKLGKNQFLKRYIEKKLKDAKPVVIARGLMVCGFALESDVAEATITQYSNKKGLLGWAAKAALYAYERNRWSKHWYTQMCNASSPEQYWTCSVLFLKIVDARYELWADDFGLKGNIAKDFEPSIRSKIKRRVEAWQKKRQQKLFGFNAPKPIFITSNINGEK